MSRIKLIIRSLFEQAKFATDFFSQNEIDLRSQLESYSAVISKHFEYFNELSISQKQRFLLRVHSFKKKKDFQYIGLEPAYHIPILVCAAAVQLTFGLRNYTMSFFKKIYVMADQYTYGFSVQPWIGHVNRKGIFISWKHFLHGYSVNADRHNVGLHEMAHALVYANFLGGFNAEQHFVEHFEKYQTRTNALMCEERWRISKIFSEQAISNFHECWAECVELFFENPSELNHEYPELYNAIKVALNQDPLNKIKILAANVAV